mgnify:CR=1 FL=1
MGTLRSIAIITNKYPNKVEPSAMVFVQQLVWTFADKGIKCNVICPMPININPKYAQLPYDTVEYTENGSEITVYRPKYVGFGKRPILGISGGKITTRNFTKAAESVIEGMLEKPSVIYGHFIVPAGIATVSIGNKYKIPAFIAIGEASLEGTVKLYGRERLSKMLEGTSGIVAVSQENKDAVLSIGGLSNNDIGVFPNGFREERFFPRDKVKAREKLGLPKDKFIVSFVGSFDERKGIERLIQAVEQLDNVFVICAGKGKLKPNSNKCLISESISNDQLPWFYSASDIFVLPTLNEGCCNAIIEAMACGLPIISSNLPFNDDILDSSNSIMINPNSTEEIKNAILDLKENNDLRNDLHLGSLAKAKKLTLQERASNIIAFIENQA